MEIIRCEHEMDPATIKWDPKYGRIGICKKCGNKIYNRNIIIKPQRVKPKMSKKQRKKLRRKLWKETKKNG